MFDIEKEMTGLNYIKRQLEWLLALPFCPQIYNQIEFWIGEIYNEKIREIYERRLEGRLRSGRN